MGSDEIQAGPKGPPVLALAVGAIALGLGVGGIVAFSASKPSEESAAISAAPAPSIGAPEVAKAPKAQKATAKRLEGETGHAFALRIAKRLQDSEDESEALDYLEESLREDGPNTEVSAAKAALLKHCEALLETQSARALELALSGKRSAAQAVIATLRRRLPGSFQGKLDAVATKVKAATPKTPAEILAQKLAALSPTDAEGHYALAVWARDQGLVNDARRLFEATVKLDGFHEGARLALNHKKHRGRWYTPEQHAAQLATEAKAKATSTTVKQPVVKRQPLVPLPPPDPYAEDKEWYKDNTKIADWADAPTYESKYYLIKTNVKKEYAKRYTKMMDQYFKRFIGVFKSFLPPKRYEKSEIWIHASREEFMQENPRIPKTAGGYFRTDTKRVHAYHGLFGPSGTTRTVLAHEATHQFEELVLTRGFRNAPVWILEGLATFFESAVYHKGKIRIGLIPRDRLWSLKRGLKAGKLLTLTQIFQTPQRQFTGYHYAHAWSLIYMVIYYGKNEKTRKACQRWFSELFSDALKKRVSPKDVERKIGGREALLQLEARWKEWLAELKYDYDPKKGR